VTSAAGKTMKPFLKWAGGKARIVERIKAVVLPPGRRLVEPFVGSGALFLNAEFSTYLLADANHDLINCYQQFQRGGWRLSTCVRPTSHLPTINPTPIMPARSLQYDG
jgi:site-specific DNA-adenine methylase